jgi:hypothetical protein
VRAHAWGRLAVSDAKIDNQEKQRTHACHDRQALACINRQATAACTVVLDLYKTKPKPKPILESSFSREKKTQNYHDLYERKREDVSMTSSHGALIIAGFDGNECCNVVNKNPSQVRMTFKLCVLKKTSLTDLCILLLISISPTVSQHPACCLQSE